MHLTEIAAANQSPLPLSEKMFSDKAVLLTFDVLRAPERCTNFLSFSRKIFWILSRGTTTESPSSSEQAVFKALPFRKLNEQQEEEEKNNTRGKRRQQHQ